MKGDENSFESSLLWLVCSDLTDKDDHKIPLSVNEKIEALLLNNTSEMPLDKARILIARGASRVRLSVALRKRKFERQSDMNKLIEIVKRGGHESKDGESQSEV